MMNTAELESILRKNGIDPIKVAKFNRPLTQPNMGTEITSDGQGVQPLEQGNHTSLERVSIINALTNGNNVTNGYTPAGYAIGCVPEEYPATAIEKEQGNNGHTPSPTQADVPGNGDVPAEVIENNCEQGEDDAARATIMPAPFYLKVDLFDNGTGKNGKSKSNRYKVKIHFCMEDGGLMHSYLGAFHPVARGFRNNVPEGYEQDEFYVEIDHAIDRANLGDTKYHIRPLGAKFKDADNKVIIYTAAIVFWEASEQHPTILVSLQGWGTEVVLDKRPAGSRAGNNLLAYGIWINPDMKTKREVFENKKGGKTLLETMRLEKMGLK
ncbi:hypothetical protein [Methylobacterium sp. SD21]|uniref:hypothetical protein n=1 Tax=Methylobacterium litchii TaxID=3138810 RepID=UPI00313B7E4D